MEKASEWTLNIQRSWQMSKTSAALLELQYEYVGKHLSSCDQWHWLSVCDLILICGERFGFARHSQTTCRAHKELTRINIFSKQICQKDLSYHQFLWAQLAPVYLKCLGKKATHGRTAASQITRLIACGLHNMKMWQLSLMPLPLCKAGKGEPSHANASHHFLTILSAWQLLTIKRNWIIRKKLVFFSRQDSL